METNNKSKEIETGFLINLKEIRSRLICGDKYKDYEIKNKLKELKE